MPVRLEDLKPDAQVLGLVGKESVRILSTQMMGDAACQVLYRRQDGGIGDTIAFRSQEAELELWAGGWCSASFPRNRNAIRAVRPVTTRAESKVQD